LQFGDSDVELLEQLQHEYPNAQLSAMPPAAHADFAQWMHALELHLQGQQPHLDLPIDLRGTAFQLKVWEFLRQLPYGDVMSYQELANAIDAPRATRAVASACAANRIGVIVPCHRVIRGDGGMGGYRWGIPRKRTLLDTERRSSRVPPKK
jgi:AraC family transcriptional regulator of adaptative response/methylated-DNA-[protein]-cysteine methyltransferase